MVEGNEMGTNRNYKLYSVAPWVAFLPLILLQIPFNILFLSQLYPHISKINTTSFPVNAIAAIPG
jgi:hypothetical protein